MVEFLLLHYLVRIHSQDGATTEYIYARCQGPVFSLLTSCGQSMCVFQQHTRLQCCNYSEGTAAAAPPPLRPSDPALCGSCPLVTPYYCRLGDLLCYSCLLYLSSFCVCMHMCNLCFLCFFGLFSFTAFSFSTLV